MGHWPTIEAMQEEFNENLEQYIKEHPNEFVLFQGEPRNFETTFYKTQEEVDRVINERIGTFSAASYLVKSIPSKTHRFNSGNKTKESFDTYVEFCANDGETVLLPQGIEIVWNGGNPLYSEKAVCPDCGYVATRRPTDENIRRLGEQFSRVVSIGQG